eukprot:m.435835 g.435835  ORF g.435835 m.435835 type:complete len:98 (+) comp17900_c0_seq1:61-354(+)
MCRKVNFLFFLSNQIIYDAGDDVGVIVHRKIRVTPAITKRKKVSLNQTETFELRRGRNDAGRRKSDSWGGGRGRAGCGIGVHQGGGLAQAPHPTALP